MKKWHKVVLMAGILLNLGLALLMLALLLFGNRVNFFSKNHYAFILPNAEGLIPGSKVMVAGITAGSVDSLSLEPKSKNVRVEVDINKKYQTAIRSDSFVDLTAQGILGDRVVMIAVGSPDQPEIRDGGVIPTRNITGIIRILSQSEKLVAHLDELMEHLDQVVGSFTPRRGRKSLSQNAADTFAYLSHFSHKLDKGLDIKRLNDSILKMNQILTKIHRGTGTLGALINDPAIYDDTKAFIGEANRNRVVRNLVRKVVSDAE